MPATHTLFVTAVLTAALSAAAGACSQGGSPPGEPRGDATGPSGTDDDADLASGASAAPTDATGSPAPTDLAVDITNDPPDGGVVMNNAQTSKDAGASDRLKPIMDLVTQNRDKFRVCFDEWGRQNPGRDVKITLSIKLKPSGELVSAVFKPDESDLADKKMESCMASVASSIKYPESPKGMETTYNHRFQFKSKK
jgi:hypothetical protein